MSKIKTELERTLWLKLDLKIFSKFWLQTQLSGKNSLAVAANDLSSYKVIDNSFKNDSSVRRQNKLL